MIRFRGIYCYLLLLDTTFIAGKVRLDVLDSILNLISFSAILWSTSQTLTGALAVYAAWQKLVQPGSPYLEIYYHDCHDTMRLLH